MNLSEDELQALWKMYKKRQLPETYHYVLRHFLFMCFTGIRISDLMALTFDGIIADTLFYFPVKTRGRTKRAAKVPLNKYAKQLIADEGRSAGKVFSMISEQRMNMKLKDIALGAKISKRITNHSARHTFATTWLAQTHDLAALQKLLGHSKIADTMKYVHITDDMLRSQMKAFEKSVFKKKKDKKNPGSSEPG